MHSRVSGDHPPARHVGFSLIEVLIVVAVLGILAAIVVPRYTTATTVASQSTALRNLQNLRNAIGLYTAKYEGQPDLIGPPMWRSLVIDHDFLIMPPMNPLNYSTTVAATAGVGVGWVWSASTGEIFATDENFLPLAD